MTEGKPVSTDNVDEQTTQYAPQGALQHGVEVQPTISRGHHDGAAPLSYAQQRLWLIDQLYKGTGAYNLAGIIRFTDQMNVALLERSIEAIVTRHEALRTRFILVAGEPVQDVIPPQAFSLTVEETSHSSPEAIELWVQQRVNQEARTPFDLSVAPLLRAILLRCGPLESRLLIVIHHIVSDGWSMEIFSRELAQLYQAFMAERPSPLTDLPIQYVDYTLWQLRWLRGAVLREQLGYWMQQLAGAPTILELPSDHVRPPVASMNGAVRPFTIDATLAQQLRALAREENATLFMILLAAFQLLLARCVDQDDLLVGTPIAGRMIPHTQDLIGFFVNTLVLRGDLSGQPSFRTLLQRSRAMCLDAYSHQDLPFQRVVEELQPARDLSRNPLVQVLFALQPAPSQHDAAGEFMWSEWEEGTGTSLVDLFLEVRDAEGLLSGRCTYSTDLFTASTIDRLLAHFQVLLTSIVTEPDRCIWDLPLLSEADKTLQFNTWNATETPYPRTTSIHELFSIQSRAQPDTIAVVFGAQQLTYRELEERSNQLARYLQAQGVRPETIVGLCVDRSSDAIVGMLGILKAGGAYLPLDPALPAARLKFLLEDGKVPLVLTQQQVQPRISEQLRPVPTIALDDENALFHRESSAPIASRSLPDTLAYVIYTSGSTGVPKGVAISHRGVVRLVRNTNYAHLSHNEVILQFAPLSFDAATFEIWGALLNGGRLVIFPSPHAELDRLGAVIKESRVTTLWLTSALFQYMVEHHLTALDEVRELIGGGDVLPVSSVQRFLRAFPDRVLINGYGPTENTTFSCCFHATDPGQLGTTVPIGRPVANTQVYLLDRHLQPVPIGVPGDLYIGGAGLARGYLHQPALTAAAFLPHPFSAQPGARLYCTGDRARYRPDGQLEFLGRRDAQVKLRGFRVEPAEIEAALGQHPSVIVSTVIAYEDDMGNKRLAAFVVVSRHQTPASHSADVSNAAGTSYGSAADLRTYLRLHLPDYMIPSLTIIDALPHTPNGKVDRAALLQIANQRVPEPDRDQAASDNPLQQTLHEIWHQVLGRSDFDVNQDFFEIGGHSLLATRVVIRMREQLGVTIPLRLLFEAPTIADLAQRLAPLVAVADLSLASPTQAAPDPEARRDRLLERIDQLSDEEIEALLSTLDRIQGSD